MVEGLQHSTSSSPSASYFDVHFDELVSSILGSLAPTQSGTTSDYPSVPYKHSRAIKVKIMKGETDEL